MKEINITSIPNIRIGQVEDTKAGTGCTVVICENGAFAGVYLNGGGPASREIALIDSMASTHKIHAVVLSGGSAYGLDAAGGVMSYLEEKKIGYHLVGTIVPLVCQSDIFDLGLGDSKIRPDKDMGYEAAKASEKGNYKDGCFGVGCGASIGKIHTKEFAMKSGIGSYAVQLGELMVGALVVVNAYGDVYENGKMIGGLLSEDKKSLRPSVDEMYKNYRDTKKGSIENTTLGIVVTNASFDQLGMNKIAKVADDGLSRAIRPVHTSFDGDSVYALSVGEVKAGLDTVGVLAADVVEKAIINAVKNATGGYGLPSYRDIK